MNKSAKKLLVLIVVFFFIFIGFQPVFALKEKESLVNIKNEASTRKAGPDIRILKVSIYREYWGEFYYQVNVVHADVINLGDDIVDKWCMIDSTIYRRGKELNYHSSAFVTSFWGHNVKTNVGGVFLHIFPTGIYRIHFYIGYDGDTNITDNSFDRYFFVFNFFGKFRIYPNEIYEYPEVKNK